MRVGEALALEITDLDFRNRTISVRNAKTKAGERDVCMPGGEYYKELEDALMKYMALRATWEPTTKRLFVKRPNAGERSDKPMDYQNVARSFRRISVRAGLDHMLTPHQLRHTYISKLLAKGAAPSGIAKQVGHADSGITLRIYSWAVNKEQQEAVRCYR
jgi:integrase